MTLEQKLWADLRRPLQRRGHARRVENPLDPGMPDVSFSFYDPLCDRGREGFLELKALRAWPRRPGTLARPGARPAQRLWWRERARAGGTVLALLWVEAAGEYLLFEGFVAAEIFDRSTRAELRVAAAATWSARPGGGAKAGLSNAENIVGYVFEKFRKIE